MDIISKFTVFFIKIILIFSPVILSSIISKDSKVVLILLDGFHVDYISHAKSAGYSTPNFDNLNQTGILSSAMQNEFITETFPNSWSLVTGMHAEKHGIVHDNFYDPVLNDTFDGHSTPYTKFYNNGSEGSGGQPIWVTNQLQGHRSVVALWPGSNAGVMPSFALPMNFSQSWRKRVDHLVRHMTPHGQDANLGLLYIEEPDRSGRKFGPLSQKVLKKVVKIDRMLGYLMQQLADHKLQHAELLVVSDHGLTPVRGVLSLDHYLEPDTYRLHGTPAAPMIQPLPPVSDAALHEGLSRLPHAALVRTADLPDDLHVRHNRRVAPYLLVMEDGWVAEAGGTNVTDKGMSGYNRSFASMQPLFLANGPSFSHGSSGGNEDTFSITDVYPLMCFLLGITPHPGHDGSLSRLAPWLLRRAGGRDSVAAHTVGWATVYEKRSLKATKWRILTATYIAVVILTLSLVIGSLTASYCRAGGARHAQGAKYSRLPETPDAELLSEEFARAQAWADDFP